MVLLVACAGEPRGRPAPAAPPAAPAAASLGPPETLASDARQETPGGATFTAPAGWTIRKGADRVRLEGPEPDLHVAIVDAEGTSADEAVRSAWLAERPGFDRPLRLATAAAPRDGWDERRDYEYETSPNERLVVTASAYRRGGAWAVLLLHAGLAAIDRHTARFEMLQQSLRPRGAARESFAGRTAHALDAGRIRQITGMLERALEPAGVPGVALALVQGGKVVLQGGLGARELGKPAKVDEHTLFLIGSNAKAFTTLLLARLVDEGKFGWNTPVTQVYPSFRLGDAERTREVRMKHLVCACTGLPRRDFEMFFGVVDTSPEGLMRLLGTFQPTTRLGEAYQYSNLMGAAAGIIAGAVLFPHEKLGDAFDRALYTRVFGPLGMRETTFDFRRALHANHASPHTDDIDGRTVAVTGAMGGSTVQHMPSGGGLWSNAKELTRYLQMELARGELPDGRRLVSEENLLARRKPQVVVGEDATYGMGLIVDTRWGTPLVHHGGFMNGYWSDMFFLPEHGVGGVLLTNADNGWVLLKSFVRRTLEVLFDGEPEAEEDIGFLVRAHRARFAQARERLAVPPDDGAVAGLAGRYANPLLGEIRVLRHGATCVFDFGTWQTEVATRRNDDGTTTMLTITPGVIGFEFVVATQGGLRALVLRDPQRDYTFTEMP